MNNLYPKSLSVFFPAYNEEKNIRSTIDKALTVLKKYPFKWEVIVVDDGSRDKTKIEAEKSKMVKVISQNNGGYGCALRTGFANAKYEWVVYTDSDGQFDFSQIEKFFPLINSCDAVWGYRKKRNDSLFRFILGKTWSLSLFVLLGLRLKDADCGFKMIKKSAYEKILPLVSTRGAMINAEIPCKLQKKGFKIGQVGVDHLPRMAGKSTGSNFKVAIKSYCELIKLWANLKHY